MNEKRRRASAEPKLTEKRSMKGFGKTEAYGEKKQPPPAGLKTFTMLKMASLQFGLSPYDASKDAQNLYMNGLISYPRTSSTKYSENLILKQV